MLCGIMDPTSGTGQVGGYDINHQQEQIKQNIGYMSQRFSLYDDLSVEENIDFYCGIYKVPHKRRKVRKQQIWELTGIGPFRSRLTSTLSGGWKQRLALGCAIIHEPRILFLDEPTSGVDPMARNSFWRLLKDMANRGVTTFVTTHYMDEAENCDRLALIYRGAIIAMAAPVELKKQFMKEQVLKICVSESQEWLERIKDLKGVKEAALFGICLHVVMSDTTEATRQIKALFQKEGVRDYQMEVIPPSLEDVFVSMIESFDEQGAVHGSQAS